MPARLMPLVTGQIYHVFNRGSEKRRIFESKGDYKRFLQAAIYYQIENPKPKFSNFSKQNINNLPDNQKIVEIVAYCIMPNHFHFLIKQLQDDGISKFMANLCNSHAKFYNTKYERVGPLWQGQFKAVLIENDEQLMHVSRYIHLNPLVSHLVKDLEQYKWSSYGEFIYEMTDGCCASDIVLDLFKSREGYGNFVMDQADYAEKLEIIKHQLIDLD